jgi:hypothetical protein
MPRPAALYVDGFNFYYGITRTLREACLAQHFPPSALAWCDFRALLERHALAPGERIAFIKYFTAEVTPRVEMSRIPGEHDRQHCWLEAVRTVAGLEVVEGYYKPATDDRPDARARKREEKQTDINLAVELLLDAGAARYDHAYVLSGDRDQIPAILAAAYRLPKPREITVLLPPGHVAADWEQDRDTAWRRLHLRQSGGPAPPPRPVHAVEITEAMLANSLLRYALPLADGRILKCPDFWRLPAKYLDSTCRRDRRPDHDQVDATLASGSA